MAEPKSLSRVAAKLLTEFLGTLFLCLTVALVGFHAPDLAPIAIGCVLMVCIYAGGHVSGAHYNPAVTLAVLVRGGGKLSLLDGALYVISQMFGALSATLLSWVLLGSTAGAYPSFQGASHLQACVSEIVITFALCSVVLHTATTKAQADNSHFGLAIGFTVLSGAVSVGSISGGAFNPAVGSMSLLYGVGAAADVWLYWLAPLLGGALAGGAFRIVAWQEYQDTACTERTLLAACLVEMIGTTMLCFAVGTATGLLAPMAIGSMLMVMIYMGGWVSGGHYNPAVTLAVWVRSLLGAREGRFTWLQAVRYVLAQLLGAALGTLLAWGAGGTKGKVCYPALPALHVDVPQAFVGEVLGTFLLAYTVLNVATVKRVAGNSYFGLAIGMVVTAMACAIGPLSGGAFNPAVGTMGVFLGGQGVDVLIYWLGCFLGALLAALCFRVQNFEEFQCADKGTAVSDAGECVDPPAACQV